MPSIQLYKLIASSAAVQAGGLLATLIVGILLARGLGVEGYGVYGIALGVITLLAVPVELGLPRLVLREVASAGGRHDLPTLFGAISWASRSAMVASAIIVGAGLLFFVWKFQSGLTPVDLSILIGLAVLPLGAAAAIRTNALMGLHLVLSGQLPIILLRPALFALFLAALFYWRPGASAPDAMALNVVAAAVALWFAHALFARRAPSKPSTLTQHRKRWLRSAFSMALIDGVRVVHGQVGILLLGALATTADAGIFRVASSAAIFAVLPLTLLETVSSPHFARLFSLERLDTLQRLATRAAMIGVASVGAITLFVLLFGRQLLVLLFGASFEEAYWPLVILCAAQFLNAMFGMNSILLVMTKGERQLTRALFLGLGANLIGATLLIPVLGASGAALGMAAYLLVWNVVAYYDARRLTGINTGFFGQRFRGQE